MFAGGRTAQGNTGVHRALCPGSGPLAGVAWSDILLGGRTTAAHQDAAGSEGTGDAVIAARAEVPTQRALHGPPDLTKSETGHCPICASGKCYLIAQKIIRANPGHFW